MANDKITDAGINIQDKATMIWNASEGEKK